MRRRARGLAGAVLVGVAFAGTASAVPAPDAERLAALRVTCGAASAVRVMTTGASFISDRPTVEATGVRLSTTGGRPALITDRSAPLPGRLLEWNDIERVDAGRRFVRRRTLIGVGAGVLGAALLLRNGRDIAEEGDNVMLLLAGFTLGAGTAVGYLYGTGYPVWRRVYP